jgi:hypothetical protein
LRTYAQQEDYDQESQGSELEDPELSELSEEEPDESDNSQAILAMIQHANLSAHLTESGSQNVSRVKIQNLKAYQLAANLR